MKHYPSWRYHKSLGAKIIKSEAEEASGWHMSPADFDKAEEIKDEPKEEIIVLKEKKSKKEALKKESEE